MGLGEVGMDVDILGAGALIVIILVQQVTLVNVDDVVQHGRLVCLHLDLGLADIYVKV